MHDLIELYQFTIIPSFAVFSDSFRHLVLYFINFITFIFSFLLKAFSYLFSFIPRLSSKPFNFYSTWKAHYIYFWRVHPAYLKMPIGGSTHSDVYSLGVERQGNNQSDTNTLPAKNIGANYTMPHNQAGSNNQSGSNPQGNNLSGTNPLGFNPSGTNPQGETLLPRRYNPSASNPRRFNHPGVNPHSGTNPLSATNLHGSNLTDSQNISPGFIDEGEKLSGTQRFKQNSKRRLFWVVWGIHTDKHKSYEEFKQSWKPNTKMWDEIKNDIKNETKEIVHTLTLHKRSLAWILNRRTK